MDTFYRLHPDGTDAQKLLDPEGQISEPWDGAIHGRCDNCGSSEPTRS